MTTVAELEEAIKQWGADTYVPECRKNNEEYNARVDDPECKWATKKRDFNEDYYLKTCRKGFFDWMSNGSDQELSVGTAEYVDAYREDGHYLVIFKIGNEHFQGTTDYDSWSDWDWDFASLDKVEPVVVVKTEWKIVRD